MRASEPSARLAAVLRSKVYQQGLRAKVDAAVQELKDLEAAWHEKWSEKVRKRNLLKQAGSRLMKPKLVKSFVHWQRDWESMMVATKHLSSAQLAALEAEENAKSFVNVMKELEQTKSYRSLKNLGHDSLK